MAMRSKMSLTNEFMMPIYMLYVFSKAKRLGKTTRDSVKFVGIQLRRHGPLKLSSKYYKGFFSPIRKGIFRPIRM